MNDFKQFGIVVTAKKGLKGNKIRIDKVINREIVIEDFKIGPSNFEGKGKRLDLQIVTNNETRLIFTAASKLIEVMEKITREMLPFKTTIIKDDDDSYLFT